MSKKELPSYDELQHWSIQDVVDWLKAVGFQDCIQPFQDNYIDGVKLSTMTEQSFVTMGGVPVSKRKKILKHINGISKPGTIPIKEKKASGMESFRNSVSDIRSSVSDMVCEVSESLTRINIFGKKNKQPPVPPPKINELEPSLDKSWDQNAGHHEEEEGWESDDWDDDSGPQSPGHRQPPPLPEQSSQYDDCYYESAENSDIMTPGYGQAEAFYLDPMEAPVAGDDDDDDEDYEQPISGGSNPESRPRMNGTGKAPINDPPAPPRPPKPGDRGGKKDTRPPPPPPKETVMDTSGDEYELPSDQQQRDSPPKLPPRHELTSTVPVEEEEYIVPEQQSTPAFNKEPPKLPSAAKKWNLKQTVPTQHSQTNMSAATKSNKPELTKKPNLAELKEKFNKPDNVENNNKTSSSASGNIKDRIAALQGAGAAVPLPGVKFTAKKDNDENMNKTKTSPHSSTGLPPHSNKKPSTTELSPPPIPTSQRDQTSRPPPPPVSNIPSRKPAPAPASHQTPNTFDPKKRPLPTVPQHDAMEGLYSYGWYHHDVERKAAESRLYGLGTNGSFLVRKSKQGGPTCPYSLSLYYEQKVWNLHIRLRPDQNYALGTEKPNEQTFGNVPELIQYHQQHPLILAGTRGGETILKDYPTNPKH